VCSCLTKHGCSCFLVSSEAGIPPAPHTWDTWMLARRQGFTSVERSPSRVHTRGTWPPDRGRDRHRPRSATALRSGHKASATQRCPHAAGTNASADVPPQDGGCHDWWRDRVSHLSNEVPRAYTPGEHGPPIVDGIDIASTQSVTPLHRGHKASAAHHHCGISNAKQQHEAEQQRSMQYTAC
jgi:hypothetical protein